MPKSDIDLGFKWQGIVHDTASCYGQYSFDVCENTQRGTNDPDKKANLRHWPCELVA